MSGLIINENVLDRLPIKKQVTIIRQNTEEIKEMVHGYRFHQKIQYVWLTVLTISIGLNKFMGLGAI